MPLEQKALIDAVERVAPSVVRIETIGGLERVDRVLFGAGPTTGLVVDSSGYIISSAFNFVNKPASILVRLPDGTRKPAKLVARDHNCQFVLLKIEPDHPLPVPEMAPQAEMRVGQWCVAVGRTFEESRPNMAVGILSAVGRVWGKALQTDAPASPNNYGGPLVDIHGRVMGLLVPLVAAVGRGNRRRRMVRFGHRFRRAAGGHQQGPPQAPQGRGSLLRVLPASSCNRRIFTRATR